LTTTSPASCPSAGCSTRPNGEAPGAAVATARASTTATASTWGGSCGTSAPDNPSCGSLAPAGAALGKLSRRQSEGRHGRLSLMRVRGVAAIALGFSWSNQFPPVAFACEPRGPQAFSNLGKTQRPDAACPLRKKPATTPVAALPEPVVFSEGMAQGLCRERGGLGGRTPRGAATIRPVRDARGGPCWCLGGLGQPCMRLKRGGRRTISCQGPGGAGDTLSPRPVKRLQAKGPAAKRSRHFAAGPDRAWECKNFRIIVGEVYTPDRFRRLRMTTPPTSPRPTRSIVAGSGVA